jgi:hypothetical protein
VKTKRHSIDTKDPTLKTLVGSASRIVKLLQAADAVSHDDLVGALDDLLGAVYASISAREEGFKGKRGASEFAVALDRAKDVVNGETFADGNWMPGFHFNNAMFRISAVFDRLPKAVACCQLTATKIYQKNTRRTWKRKDAHAIREQVNIFKHSAGGLYKGRRADLKVALSAVEELLELAEAFCLKLSTIE